MKNYPTCKELRITRTQGDFLQVNLASILNDYAKILHESQWAFFMWIQIFRNQKRLHHTGNLCDGFQISKLFDRHSDGFPQEI